MQHRQHKRWKWSLALAGVALLSVGMTACGGASQSDYDAAKKELAAQDQKIKALQQQLSTNAVAPAAAAGQAGQQAGLSTLIGAKLVPTPTAAPPPTPLPAGFPTPAPNVMPDFYRGPAGEFAFYVETLATTTIGQAGWVSNVACTPNSVFKRGMKLVWRFEVFDLKTGKRLTEEDNPIVKVKLPNGDDLTGHFTQRAGGRVPGAPWTWNAAWDIPMNSPLGALDYSIDVTTKDGRTMSWKAPALVAGADTDSRVKIIA